MDILVLGGTGAMGTHLVDCLSQSGHHVTVTSRQRLENTEHIGYVQGNAHASEFLQKLLHERDGKWDAVVDFMSYSTEEFSEKKDSLLQATNQYVFLSSARVYANSESPITEETPRLLDICQDAAYLSTDEYALAKARQENLLKAGQRGNYTIIRPYITFGETRFQLGVLEKESWLYRALNHRSIVFSSDMMSKKTTLTYARNVALGIAAVLGKQATLGQTFHIASETSYTWEEILETYLEEIGKHLGKRPNVTLLDTSPHIESSRKYQVIYDRYYHRCFDVSKIRQFVGTKTFQPPLPALRSCVSAFLRHPEFLYLDIPELAHMDKITGDHAKLTDFPRIRQLAKYSFYRYVK